MKTCHTALTRRRNLLLCTNCHITVLRLLTIILVVLVTQNVHAQLYNSIIDMSDDDDVDMLRQPAAIEEIGGVIHRCSKGYDGKDRQYVKVQADALRYKKLWGAYHFGRQGEDPIKQADWFIRNVQENQLVAGSPVLLVLDLEYYPSEHPTKAMSLSDAALFIKRVKEITGKAPGLYIGASYLRKMGSEAVPNDLAKQLEGTWLWIVRYYAVTKMREVGNFIPMVPAKLAWWNEWKIWQHSAAEMKIPDGAYYSNRLGKKRVDRDVFNGPPEKLARFWREHSWVPAARHYALATSK